MLESFYRTIKCYSIILQFKYDVSYDHVSPDYCALGYNIWVELDCTCTSCSKCSMHAYAQEGSETRINHVLHLHPAQGLPPHRSTAAPTSACSRHRAPPSSAAASPTAPPERHELRRVQAIPHRHRHRPWRRGRGVQ